ncbi:arylamine N-acetyltransferase [Devosia yakushimensis]|uniref:Arylamine N-acetyltransferase n=1 Tax=Devosia yakushimensis TaxID=470028 RepID=A0ABQ5UM64_9HYPH|nr:arylamine N-acetyltransferase [Devosia yakushimensis]GLQ12447.1 arylamine N-acetyltransferase [Devosia yakushimensis]
MSQKVNLNAYFERIGFAGSIAPSLATLELLHELHPAAIPFENLSPLLGLPVALDQQSLEKKLLGEKRGGYCFEHNMLLKRMLAELDYSVRGLAATVLWSDPEAVKERPDHMLVAVDISGATYIADVGFGGLTLTAPLRLRADVEQQTPHETYRFTGGDPEWRLEVKLGDDWRVLYSFTTEEWGDAAYEPINAVISGDPASPFTKQLRVALSPKGQRIKLLNNRLTIEPLEGEPEQRLLTSVAELREVLSGTFGIGLPAAELLDPKLEVILADAGVAEV